ncbi:MAG: flavin-dependent oxidoreductase [Pseudomonadota bacterium]
MTDAVAVVGAGIGGLTTALSLHRQGIEVDVYESVSELQPLGVGINLLPHAMAVLEDLDLLPQLLETGVATQSLTYFNKWGQEIWAEPRGLAAGYSVPQISIHRGELQMLLLDAVRQRLGEQHLKLGCRVLNAANVTDAHGHTRVAFHYEGDGGDITTMQAAGLIAADGIHSRLRAQFYPDEGMPLWNGAILWRGLVETEAWLGGRGMFMAGHQAQKFVAYPVDQAAYRRGRALTNWIAELRFDRTDLAEREDWNRPGNFADFADQFASWRFPWLDIAGLITAAPQCYEFPMVDREPVSRWSFGHITLLGDAAHPMYPIGSNGASQAILDARCISQCLRATTDIAEAFERYQAQRLPATAAIVRANRGNGPEQVMQLAEERAPEGFADIEQVIPLRERQEIAARYKQVAGFTPGQEQQ